MTVSLIPEQNNQYLYSLNIKIPESENIHQWVKTRMIANPE